MQQQIGLFHPLTMRLFFLPVTAILLCASAAAAQTTDECEKLKIENAKLKFENANLKKGIITRSPATVPVPGGTMSAGTQAVPAQSSQTTQHQTVRKIDFALVKCQGDAKAQTVTVTLLLTNQDANKTLHITNARAIDEQADEHQTNGTQIGTNGSSNLLTTGVSVKALTTIIRVLPTVKTLKVFSFVMYTNVELQDVPVEFRDVAIVWK